MLCSRVRVKRLGLQDFYRAGYTTFDLHAAILTAHISQVILNKFIQIIAFDEQRVCGPVFTDMIPNLCCHMVRELVHEWHYLFDVRSRCSFIVEYRKTLSKWSFKWSCIDLLLWLLHSNGQYGQTVWDDYSCALQKTPFFKILNISPSSCTCWSSIYFVRLKNRHPTLY